MTRTAEQQAVIEASTLPRTIVVTATAGSGKTFTLVERASFLVTHHQVPPGRLQFLSFTRAASQELRRRLEDRRLGAAKVHTLHGKAHKLLNTSDYAYKQMSAQQHDRLLKQCGCLLDPDKYLWNAEVVVKQLHRRLSQIHQCLIPADQLSAEDYELLALYRQFHEELEARMGTRLLTHDDVLLEARRLLRKRPLQSAEEREYDYVFVDEYQDVSPLQHDIVRLLAQDLQLLLVGDPAQSVFGFQGGTPSILQDARASAELSLPLSLNHRSPAEHLHAALLPLQEIRMAEPLVAARGFGGQLELSTFSQQDNLMRHLTKRVTTLLQEVGQVTVLVRTRAEIGRLATHFRALGHPVSTSADWDTVLDEVLNGRIVQHLIQNDPAVRGYLRPVVAYLSAPRKPDRRHPLTKIPLPAPLSAAEQHFLDTAWQADVGTPEICQQAEHKGFSNPGILAVLALLSTLQGLRSASASADLELELSQYVSSQPRAPRWDQVRSLCARHSTVAALAERLLPSSGSIAEQEENLHISTIHASKGREWEAVLLTEVSNEKTTAIPEEEAEEYRLRYVALTRSTQYLVLILPESCHPAYRLLQTGTVQSIHRLSRIMTAAPLEWEPGDADFLAQQLAAQPSLRRYVEEQWRKDLTAETAGLVKAHLQNAGFALRWTDVPPTKAPVSSPRVKRVPLLLPSEPHF